MRRRVALIEFYSGAFSRFTYILPMTCVLILSLSRFLHLINVNDRALVASLPDDAFYYLQVGRTRAESGFWSFDGVTRTTGFHPLYAHSLFALYSLFPDASLRFVLSVFFGISFCFLSISLFALTNFVRKEFGYPFIYISMLPFLSIAAVNQTNALMESILVLPFSTLLILLFLRLHREFSNTFRVVTFSFFLGFFGVLFRTDFIVLPFTLFLAYIIFESLKSARRKEIVLASCAGSGISYALVLLHNLLISGTFGQGSSRIKFFWSQIGGHTPEPIVNTLISNLYPLQLLYRLKEYVGIGSWLLLACLYLLIIVASRYLETKNSIKREDYAFLGTSLLISLGFISIYSFNSQGIQNWYLVYFLIPISLCLTIFFFQIDYTLSKNLIKFFPIIFVVFFLNTCLVLGQQTYPWQGNMFAAAKDLKAMPIQGKVGSWNAGIISYFSEKQIVNLDGLVNDDIYPFIISNKLIDYMLEEKIHYILDWEVMITEYSRKQRGGYVDARLNKCLLPHHIFPENGHTFGNSQLILFRFDQSCPLQD